jgi:hypothetical protein
MAVSLAIAFADPDPAAGGPGATGFALRTLAFARAVRRWLTLGGGFVREAS